MSIPTGAASVMKSILETSTSHDYHEALDWIIQSRCHKALRGGFSANYAMHTKYFLF